MVHPTFRPLPVVAGAAALAALACGGGKECGEGTVNSDKECVGIDEYLDSADTADSRANAPPDIVRASAGGGTITQDETVTVTVEVQDPDGSTDVAGGVLLDGAGHELGAFERVDAGDRWEAAVAWWDLHAIDDISFVGGEQRTLVIRFTDLAAHLVETELTLSLTCEEGDACSGICVGLDFDAENCGSCGRTCPASTYEPGYCAFGTCFVGGDCFDDFRLSCEQECVAEGWVGCLRVDGLSAVGATFDTEQTCDDWPDVRGNARSITDCDLSVAAQAEAGADIAQCFCES